MRADCAAASVPPLSIVSKPLLFQPLRQSSRLEPRILDDQSARHLRLHFNLQPSSNLDRPLRPARQLAKGYRVSTNLHRRPLRRSRALNASCFRWDSTGYGDRQPVASWYARCWCRRSVGRVSRPRGSYRDEPGTSSKGSGSRCKRRALKRTCWGKLTDDDLDRVDGRLGPPQPVLLLQAKYGYARDKAEAEIRTESLAEEDDRVAVAEERKTRAPWVVSDAFYWPKPRARRARRLGLGLRARPTPGSPTSQVEDQCADGTPSRQPDQRRHQERRRHAHRQPSIVQTEKDRGDPRGPQHHRRPRRHYGHDRRPRVGDGSAKAPTSRIVRIQDKTSTTAGIAMAVKRPAARTTPTSRACRSAIDTREGVVYLTGSVRNRDGGGSKATTLARDTKHDSKDGPSSTSTVEKELNGGHGGHPVPDSRLVLVLAALAVVVVRQPIRAAARRSRSRRELPTFLERTISGRFPRDSAMSDQAMSVSRKRPAHRIPRSAPPAGAGVAFALRAPTPGEETPPACWRAGAATSGTGSGGSRGRDSKEAIRDQAPDRPTSMSGLKKLADLPSPRRQETAARRTSRHGRASRHPREGRGGDTGPPLGPSNSLGAARARRPEAKGQSAVRATRARSRSGRSRSGG